MMKTHKVIVRVAIGGVVLIASLLLLTSPLSRDLFGEGNDTADDIFALTVAVTALSTIAVFAITTIIACCYLGKRLGYDLYAGLLLLIPIVNIIVFLAWAFRESPNEKALARARRQIKH